MPAGARDPCDLYQLPNEPTDADLDAGFTARGADLVACDIRRELAVKTFDEQIAALARTSKKPRWSIMSFFRNK